MNAWQNGHIHGSEKCLESFHRQGIKANPLKASVLICEAEQGFRSLQSFVSLLPLLGWVASFPPLHLLWHVYHKLINKTIQPCFEAFFWLLKQWKSLHRQEQNITKYPNNLSTTYPLTGTFQCVHSRAERAISTCLRQIFIFWCNLPLCCKTVSDHFPIIYL
jgi:hypothetical protein